MHHVNKTCSPIHALTYSILLLALGVTADAQSQADDVSVSRLLATSNDYLSLVEEHWDKAMGGDHLSMMIAYHALNNCANFRDAIAASKNVDELESNLASRSPKDVLFAKGVYYKCKNLVENLDSFADYKKLRMQAALAGNIEARVWMAFEFYKHKSRVAREDIPFSPAEYLTEAMIAGNHLVFELTAAYGGAYGLLPDESIDLSVTWWLVGCRFRGDCDQASSLDVMCHFMTSECLDAENLFDVYLKRSSDRNAFAASQKLADELYAKIVERRFSELNMNLEW